MGDTAPNQQQILDNEHLRLLSIFHYIKGGLTGLFFLHSDHPRGPWPGHDYRSPGVWTWRGSASCIPWWLFVILGICIILLGWTFAALTLIAGRCIARRKHRTFCLVWACVQCISVPFGTVLGVFTILVLSRASVTALFGQEPATR